MSELRRRSHSTGKDELVLPESWALQAGLNDDTEPPEEVGGPIGKMVKGAKATFDKINSDVRREADRRLVVSLRFILKKVGATVLTGLHDSAMPAALHRAIDGIFLSVWPEVEKGILDGLVLDLGFQFDKYRKRILEHEAEPPDGWLDWCKATLLYAMLPYDLSFFGMVRQPLLFSINMVFLFPLYGVDSITIITLWLATYKYDEHQLTSFIIKSKGLAFITAGCITGVLGFVKLYACAIVTDPESPKACKYKAPGVTATYEWEFWCFQVRTVLVWITFYMLFNIEQRSARKRRRDAHKARLAANPAAARRGLPPASLGVALQLIGLAGFVGLGASWLQAADRSAGGGLFPLLSSELATLNDALSLVGGGLHIGSGRRRLEESASGDAAPAAAVGTADALASLAYGSLTSLALLLWALLAVRRLLRKRKPNAWPAARAAALAAALLAYFGWALYAGRAAGRPWVGAIDDEKTEGGTEGGTEGLAFVGGAALLSLACLLTSVGLVLLQHIAASHDARSLKKLETILKGMDEDDSGVVDRDEFKAKYKELFPSYPHSFDSLWKKLDANGDGQLSRDELADALGLGHLRAGYRAPEEETASEVLARAIEAVEGNDVDAKLVQLQAEGQRLRKHHLRAGGVMNYFFAYDLVSMGLLFWYAYYGLDSQGIHHGDWRFATTLYFTRMAMGLLSAPFLVFKVPLHLSSPLSSLLSSLLSSHLSSPPSFPLISPLLSPLGAVSDRLPGAARQHVADTRAADGVRQGGAVRLAAAWIRDEPALRRAAGGAARGAGGTAG